MRFTFEGASEIKTEDEYRSGLSVVFTPWLGPKRMQPISIDLVIDEIPLDEAELVTPADRIPVEGVEAFDYLVYPVENALADKLCAMLERHGGRPSSRVKDLVDILVYAVTCPIDGSKLAANIKREAGARKICLPGHFVLPEGWEGRFASEHNPLSRCVQAKQSNRVYSSTSECLCHSLSKCRLDTTAQRRKRNTDTSEALAARQREGALNAPAINRPMTSTI